MRAIYVSAGVLLFVGYAAQACGHEPPATGINNQSEVGEVTVTAKRPSVEVDIDRRSYAIGKELQATTGSLADALRNIPSVDVDVRGTLSLRGDSRVTILIDGKPAPEFQGRGRADALQQLPADQFERVEVATTGSADLNPEGSAGVINLIRKRSAGAGRSAQVYALAGSAGLKRTGVGFGFNSKKLAVSGSLLAAHQRGKLAGDYRRTRAAPGAEPESENVQLSSDSSRARVPSARLNMRYAASPRNDVSAAASFTERDRDNELYNRFEDVEAGAPAGSRRTLERLGDKRFLQIDTAISGGWKHRFRTDGEELTFDAVHNETSLRDRTVWTALRASPPDAPLESMRDDAEQEHTELTLSYLRPLLGGGTLKLGYEFKLDDDRFDFGIARGSARSALAADPAADNRFLFKQIINAAYATWERPFGNVAVKAGTRVEDVRTDLSQLSSLQSGELDYTRVYPSLHLTYKRSERTTLSAAVSSRVERPASFLLNPRPYQIDPRNIQQGNPRLKPQETTSIELAVDWRDNATTRLATVYFRDNHNELTSTLIGGAEGRYVTAFDNFGRSRTAGLEVVATGKLSSTLTYNASATGYWAEVEAEPRAGEERRSIVAVSGRANLDWQVRPDDVLQANVSVQGKRILAQGYSAPSYVLNFGWQHKLSDRAAFTLVLSDALSSARYVRRLSGVSITESYRVDPPSGSVVMRLDYRFGGGAARRPTFNYDAGNAVPSR